MFYAGESCLININMDPLHAVVSISSTILGAGNLNNPPLQPW